MAQGVGDTAVNAVGCTVSARWGSLSRQQSLTFNKQPHNCKCHRLMPMRKDS